MAEKERILVVDDEPSIRKYLRTLLEVDGYQVEAVTSGTEAFEKIENGERPDFIILDVLMPEMNGLETLKQLMQIDRSLNVVMLSCSNEVGTVVEAIRLGAQDYLTKPFEKAELDVAMLKCRQKQQLRAENKALREYCDTSPRTCASSPPARRWCASASRFCKSLRWTCRCSFTAKAAWARKWSRA